MRRAEAVGLARELLDLALERFHARQDRAELELARDPLEQRTARARGVRHLAIVDRRIIITRQLVIQVSAVTCSGCNVRR